MSQRFCLRWNNHQSNMLSVFDQLLHDESFVDVTLAVDGQVLRAHKMVLSACSPLFQALFIGHPDKHPIVILKDVPYNDMRCLLDFMYRGEVSVDQDRLTAFLKVAESLRIKGLTEVNEEKCDIPSITNNLLSAIPQAHSTPAAPPPPHLQRIQMPQKRTMPPLVASNPLLGSALTAPKRKRGRPRRVSGSSDDPHVRDGSPHELDGEMDLEYDSQRNTGSEHGSPPPQDLMEMRMDYGQRANSVGRLNKSSDRDDSSGVEDGSSQSPLKDSPTPTKSAPQTPRRSKEDPEPTPGTSSQVPLLIPKTEALSRSGSVEHANNNNNTKDGGKDQTLTNTTSNANSSLDGSESFASDVTTTPSSGRQPTRRRARRRAASSSQDPAEQLTEMSVRGLNLFRYASVTEGVYKCMECAKVDVIKTFKNKYSFQRHAFLYHEGCQRKVFPCPVCAKEFSRPDKMKNHMKTVHDCFMPKDCVFPVNFYMPEGNANFP
ncbi:protein tramtrack, alpha isoform isoform X3 [Frankliniella occidentalis]|uniref:Protein tramtrack, alpha isoform isoform X3 n=1 Tax=Frankliniella occidentalis TaxID=133901 RepID=A0A6J1RX31_FRAOC|nr:protein tramtrack, alpha isoform isoform X3 [Frankliniella occidentalis]